MNKKLILVIVLGVFLFIGLVFKNYNETNIKPELKSPTKTEKQVNNDEELIKEALVNKNDWNAKETIIAVTQNDGQYATGSVGDGPGGGHFFAAKVDGDWEIVWDGNGFVMCENLVDYPDFPTNLIPSCYDSLTDETVER